MYHPWYMAQHKMFGKDQVYHITSAKSAPKLDEVQILNGNINHHST